MKNKKLSHALIVAASMMILGACSPVAPHTHSYQTWIQVDDANHQSTCSCGEVQVEGHTWDEGVVTTQPTHLEFGVKTFTCTKCSAQRTEPVAKLSTHNYGAWEKVDDNQHKKECACGDVVLENHTWNAGVVTTQPTHLEYGEKTFTCTKCSATKTEAVAKLPDHSYGDWQKEDDTNHIKTCACGDFVREAHTWNAGVVTTQPTHLEYGEKTFTCTKCSAQKTEQVAKLPDHSYGDWEYEDATNHVKECECGDEVREAHDWDAGSLTSEGSETEDGVWTYNCKVCGGTKTEAVKFFAKEMDLKAPFDFTKVDETKTLADVINLAGNASVFLPSENKLTLAKDRLRNCSVEKFLLTFSDGTRGLVKLSYYNLLIYTEADLRAINTTYLDYYDDINTLGRFKLMNNIELKENWAKENWIGWKTGYDDKWKPSSVMGFNGTFDGNGYTISNLVIDRPGEQISSGFIYVLAKDGVVKNLTLIGKTNAGLGGCGRGSLLLGKAMGGKIENCKIVVTFSADGYDKTHLAGGLLGFVSEVKQNEDVTVKDTVVIAGDDDTSNADWSNAIGLNGDDYAYDKTITMENVTFVGFKHLFYDHMTTDKVFDTIETLPDYFQCTNCKAVTKEEYFKDLAVKDDADIVKGYDFSKVYTKASLVSIKCDGANVPHTNGVVDLSSRLDKWKTADTGVKYQVTFADGTIVPVTLDIYTFLIRTEEDLRNVTKNLFIYDTPAATVGYVKLMNDIEMTEEWDMIDQIGLGIVENGFTADAAALDGYSYGQGFRGTFDGNNHKITNFKVHQSNALSRGGQPYESMGLIHALGKDGVIKNLTLEGETDRGNGTKGGFLIGRTHAGTIENVTLKVKMTQQGSRTHNAAALLGSLSVRPANDNINVKNVTIIAADADTGTYDFTNPLGSVCDDFDWNDTRGDATTQAAKINLTDVTLIGFKALFYDARANSNVGAAYYNVADLPAYIVCNNVVAKAAE